MIDPLLATVILWTIVIITCDMVYWDIKVRNPHWEMRAELSTMFIAILVLVAVAWAISPITAPSAEIEPRPPTTNIYA